MARALEDIEIPNELPVKEQIRLEPTNRRIRVFFNGVAVADSEKAVVLLERNHLPVYYFPKRDVKMDHLSQTEQHTTCPIKGEASYWTVRVGDRSAENAAWGYPRPIDGAPEVLGDYVAFYWDRMDAWFEEDEKVFSHPKNPYHRIDVLHSSKHVQVKVDGELVADSHQPRLLIETQLPVRYYLPRIDVRMDLLEPSSTETWCAYKGKASYWSIKLPGRTLKDAVWTYDPPQPEYAKINGLLCFYNEKVDLIVDGKPGSRPKTQWS